MMRTFHRPVLRTFEEHHFITSKGLSLVCLISCWPWVRLLAEVWTDVASAASLTGCNRQDRHMMRTFHRPVLRTFEEHHFITSKGLSLDCLISCLPCVCLLAEVWTDVA